jgi:hypothetical protein
LASTFFAPRLLADCAVKPPLTADCFLEAGGSVFVADAFNALFALADNAGLLDSAESFLRAAEADLLVMTFCASTLISA